MFTIIDNNLPDRKREIATSPFSDVSDPPVPVRKKSGV